MRAAILIFIISSVLVQNNLGMKCPQCDDKAGAVKCDDKVKPTDCANKDVKSCEALIMSLPGNTKGDDLVIKSCDIKETTMAQDGCVKFVNKGAGLSGDRCFCSTDGCDPLKAGGPLSSSASLALMFSSFFLVSLSKFL